MSFSTQSRDSRRDEVFSRHVLRLAAQACKASGFDAVDPVALQSIAEAYTSFLFQLCDTGRSLSELSGRSRSNALDLFASMTETGLGPEELTEQLFSSNALHSIPTTAVTTKNSDSSTHLQSREQDSFFKPRKDIIYEPPTPFLQSEAIPEHFPSLPPPHTWQRTAIESTVVSQQEKHRQALLFSRTLESNLAKLLGQIDAIRNPRHRTSLSQRAG